MSQPKLRAYMLTPRVRKADREAARRAGATGYVEKPFKAQQLHALVARHREPTPSRLRR